MAARSRFFYARVAVLLALLVVVIAYAVHDVQSRRARKSWDHTLAIAVIVIRSGPVSDAAIDALRERTPAFEARLESELHRYKPGAPAPFKITVFGPVDSASAPPETKSDGIIALASHAWDLRSWTRDIDARANVAAGAYDSRIYVTASLPKGKKHMIEGSSEQGGRIGVVAVELDDTAIVGSAADAAMVDFAWSVIGHELFHTLDATDHYDDAGRAKIPEGLAEPDRVPIVPQRFVEIMTRGRIVSANEERVLDTLDELAVGPLTAREVGWSQEK